MSSDPPLDRSYIIATAEKFAEQGMDHLVNFARHLSEEAKAVLREREVWNKLKERAK